MTATLDLPTAELDRVRTQIAAARKMVDEVARAARHPQDVRADLGASVDWQISRHIPQVFFESFCTPGRDTGSSLELYGDAIPDPRGIVLAQLAYFFGKDALLDVIMKNLAAAGKLGELSDHERQARLKELRAELDRLEYCEEVEILELEAAGHMVLRRRDARPEILLKAWADASIEPSGNREAA